MTWILVGGAVICGWAMLRTMGGERDRRLIERDANASINVPAAPGAGTHAVPHHKPMHPQRRPPRQAA